MNVALDRAYRRCWQFTSQSGSNFYRSFSLLRPDRRRGMAALYAFAKLVDDWGDASPRKHQADQAGDWHAWIDACYDRMNVPIYPSRLSFESLPEECGSIQLALLDTIERFAIPKKHLHAIVDGVTFDLREPFSIDHREQLDQYCDWVASAVGLACLSIWGGNRPEVYLSAIDCGRAFQLTNILRDIKEDRERGRIYVPRDLLLAHHVDAERWSQGQANGDWQAALQTMVGWARTAYRSGWHVQAALDPDGKRMFSLMWHTYRRLLERIATDLDEVWVRRIRLSRFEKSTLYLQHAFTPLYRRLSSKDDSDAPPPSSLTPVKTWESGTEAMDKGQHIVVIGGGLSGMAAALSLAECGFQITLLEAKSRLGGRVGSFDDVVSGQAVDYCQHVGMACCTNLVKFLNLLGIDDAWERQETLHFFSKLGVHLPLRAAMLPAPLHLTGLLLRWPDLTWIDRIRIFWGLFRLMRLKPAPEHDHFLAVDWLRSTAQTPRTLSHFWATILVSALGEQIDRVTLQATRKVLIDGFAANRSAYHLLVPKQKLSRLIVDRAEAILAERGVTTRLASPVKCIRWQSEKSPSVELADRTTLHADQVVIAVPWHQIQRLFPDDRVGNPNVIQSWLEQVITLESAPITGVHTWWNQPWLDPPHAILIDRLCQWIFKNPEDQLESQNEYYYQIVISGSRNLPRGDQQASMDAIVHDLQSIFPNAAQARLLRSRIVTDPNSVFSVAKGHQSARPRCDLFADHRLWLCGDWTDTGWPATMEGAVRSGFSVTDSIANRLGSTQRWIAPDLPRGWLARLLIRS